MPVLARAHVVGVWSAVTAPGWLEDSRWRALLAEGGVGRLRLQEAEAAARTARRVLRILSFTPGGYWRYTCLYRSVAECRALRHFGLQAILRIGAAQAGAAGVLAHAWVDRPGVTDEPTLNGRPLHVLGAEG